MTNGRRRLASRLLAFVTVLAVLVTTLAWYANRTLFDSQTFANRAVSVLDQPAVQERLADEITDAVIAQVPNAVAARPLIQSVAGFLVSSPALQSLLAAGVEDVHRTVIEGDTDTVVVTLENIGVLIRQGLRAAAPQIADEVSRNLDINVVSGDDLEGEQWFIDATQLAHGLKILNWAALAVALLAALGTILTARTRLVGIRRLGWGLAIGGIVAVVVWQIGRGIVGAQVDDDTADAAKAVYTAFLGDLRTWLLILTGAGLVIAAGATSTREPVDVRRLLAQGWGWIERVPERLPLRIGRALLLIAVGVLVLRNRDAFVQVVVVALGAFVVYVGAAELMRMAAGAARSDEERRVAAGAERDLSPAGLARIAGVGLLLLLGFVALGIGTNKEERPPLKVDTCNGSVELCDRRLDEVAFAGTHNSMSAATYRDWFFAQQEDGIGAQLDAGIRALLIDPHYGVETPKGVATDLEKDNGSRQKIEAGLGSDAVKAAEALRAQIGYQGGGDTEVFLCHAFCELGAIRFQAGLREVRDFLIANPGEVVVMSIEDATTPRDTVADIEAAGLGDLIYKGPNEPLPTLREMIDSDQRLFVMAERDGGDPSWYRRQFQITQETPYSFSKPEQLAKPSSCDENRGSPDAPFFLMNNWVDTSPAPQPSNAKKVNKKKFLLDRVEMCTELRGVQPNIIAVDFYKEGDVLGAVNELNGIG